MLDACWPLDRGYPAVPGAKTTLTAYLVRGKAPGIVTGHVKVISNVIKDTFTIGS